MNKETFEKLLVSEETNAAKAQALAEVIAAKERAEADVEKAKLENEAALQKAKADLEKAEAEKVKAENELKANLAKVEMERDKFAAEKEAALAKVEADKERTETEAKTEKKNRILGYVKAALTFLGILFTGGVSIWNMVSVLHQEEHGTIRSKAWLGVRPDKPTEIR